MRRSATVLVALLCATPGFAANVLTTGSIAWAVCAKDYPTDIRFEAHKKPGRVEVVHDGESGSVDLNSDNSIGADNQAGKDGKAKTVKLTGSITKGSITRGTCTGTYTAK